MEATTHHPEIFEISEGDGSAYYVLDTDLGPELVQAPLLRDGTPQWDAAGAVDWYHGIEDDDTRQRLERTQRRLLLRAALQRLKDAATEVNELWEPGTAMVYPGELPSFDELTMALHGIEVM